LPHRLGDVVVRARLQSTRDVVVAVARGGEDDRRLRRAGSDGLQDLQPVAIRQMPVEQVKIERLSGERALQGVAAVEVVADMAGPFQPLAQQRRLIRVVLEICDAHAAPSLANVTG